MVRNNFQCGKTYRKLPKSILELNFFVSRYHEIMEKEKFLMANELRAPSALEQLLPWLTQPPLITTYRVNLLKTTVHSFKERLHNLLAEKYEKPPKLFTIDGLPEVICIDAVQGPKPKPDSTMKEVIVDTGCGAALLRGAHVYAPGVIAMQIGTRMGEKVQVFCDLASLCQKGSKTRYESPHKLFIGLGHVRKQRHQLYSPQPSNAAVTGIAIEMESTISGVPTLGNLSSCEALLQNLPSIVAVHVLAPQKGERILDMCASPGNKTTHIAELINDDGLIIALDKSKQKTIRVREKIWRNAVSSIYPFAHDATKAFAEKGGGNDLTNPADYSPPYAENIFDRILLDAPCTSLGNRPLFHCTLSASIFPSYPKVQKQLIANAVPLLKFNGVLVYSTCTITEEENEGVVVWALQKFPQLQLVEASPKLGGDGLPNVGLTNKQRELVQRFGPASYNRDKSINTVGFFIAKFVKTSLSSKENSY